jgi:hypothetical protein
MDSGDDSRPFFRHADIYRGQYSFELRPPHVANDADQLSAAEVSRNSEGCSQNIDIGKVVQKLHRQIMLPTLRTLDPCAVRIAIHRIIQSEITLKHH